MKKMIRILLGSLLLLGAGHAFASNLIDVYKDALENDPLFQQALANRDIAAQEVPLNFASLLPQFSVAGEIGYEKIHAQGNNISYLAPGELDNTQKQNTAGFTLTLSQTIFNFTNWMQLASAHNTVKAAYASYTAAVQDLIQRTSQAYFDVLKAEDTLRYTEAAKRAFYKQYIQAKESYEVGLKTITDVYNAKASYDAAIANVVSAQNDVENQRENLLAITGKSYGRLAPLVRLPLAKPNPANIDVWTSTSISHNWGLTAAHYTMLSYRDLIKAAKGGHMPTVDFNGSFDNTYAKNLNQSGSARVKDFTTTLNLNVPVYQGGSITAQVKQAIAQYDLSSGQFQQTYRETVKLTRQSYLGAISGISKVHADEQSVISQRNSLEGMQEGYRVGTRTIVDVLNAESRLYEAERQNAVDRYVYVMSLVNLKQAAGTLTVNDVSEVNSWLGSASAPVAAHKSMTINKGTKVHSIAKHSATAKIVAKKPTVKTPVKTTVTAKNTVKSTAKPSSAPHVVAKNTIKPPVKQHTVAAKAPAKSTATSTTTAQYYTIQQPTNNLVKKV